MGDGVVAETGAANYLFWPLLSKQRLQALDPEVRETLEVASKGHLSRVAKVRCGPNSRQDSKSCQKTNRGCSMLMRCIVHLVEAFAFAMHHWPGIVCRQQLMFD